jgi:superfamily II DNA or RNA helicase
MDINKKKLARQHAFLAKWKQNGYKGTLSAVTGFGKSFVAVLLIQNMQTKYPQATTLIVVPTIKLKLQWEELVEEFRLSGVTVNVINTAVKSDWDINLLVLDEIHRYASEVFSEIFDNTKYQYILGLTATMERQDEKHHMLSTYAPVIDEVDMIEALEKGYISNFNIFNIGLEMTFSDQARYRKLHENFISYFKFFDFDFKLAMSMLNRHNGNTARFAKQGGHEEQDVYVKAINFSKSMQNRKKFLYNNESKKIAAKQAVELFPVKTITFAETTAFADELTEFLGEDISFSYHSKLGKKKKAELLKKFEDPSDPLRVINTARSLDEGFNMESLEMAIICSGSSTKRQYIQRVGRTVRVREGKTALIFNLYLKGTQDENWLKGRGLMPNSVFADSVSQITYSEKRKCYTKAGDMDSFSLVEEEEEDDDNNYEIN